MSMALFWATALRAIEKTAAGVAKRTGGKVLSYVLERTEERDSEIDMLRSAVIQLQRERDEAYGKISELDGGREWLENS